MDRRSFFKSMGAGMLVPAGGISAPERSNAGTPNAARRRIELNGAWERHVHGVFLDTVAVPSSLRPSGFYKIRRAFTMPRLSAGQRAFLRFEAITYHGRAFVNGFEAGVMGPYVPYEFDVTRLLREGANVVETAIADLIPEPGGAGADELAIGINPGWEAYGGIIRDVFLEVRPAAFIDNVRLRYSLGQTPGNVLAVATVFVSSDRAAAGRLEVDLSQGETTVARAGQDVRIPAGSSEFDLSFEVPSPALWSPDRPNLYRLSAALAAAGVTDAWTTRTGFRRIAVRGRDLEWNGERILLNGVCRHDLWKDQGFTLTREQMEHDMRSIKALGANYVRLSHYPHHRYIVELADEIGLLVSEEPGFWQVDFRDMPRPRVETGLRILERAIRRDWNSPSVFAWLLGNESRLTADYLREGAHWCRKLDPTGRLVSFANSQRMEEAKPIFEESGMDFFTTHPYTFNVAEFEKIAEFYGPGKPLVFTEWGGRQIGQSEIIMPRTVDKLLELGEKGLLAGHAFWSWQDLPEFSRIDPEMRDGILESGVVSEERQRRHEVWLELSRLFAGVRSPVLPADVHPAVQPLRRTPWTAGSRLEPLDLQPLAESPAGRRAWGEFEAALSKFWSEQVFTRDHWKRTGEKFRLWKDPELAILDAVFLCPVIDGWFRALVLTEGMPEIEIAVGRKCRRLHVLGHVTAPLGYPSDGKAGEVEATYTIRYADGAESSVPLRHGYEVARANLIHVATRFDPVATQAQRALLFVKDHAREQYQALLYSLELSGAEVESVICRLSPGQPPMLIFGAVTETEAR